MLSGFRTLSVWDGSILADDRKPDLQLVSEQIWTFAQAFVLVQGLFLAKTSSRLILSIQKVLERFLKLTGVSRKSLKHIWKCLGWDLEDLCVNSLLNEVAVLPTNFSSWSSFILIFVHPWSALTSHLRLSLISVDQTSSFITDQSWPSSSFIPDQRWL